MATGVGLSQSNFAMRFSASSLVTSAFRLLQSNIKKNSKLFDIGTGDGATTMHSFIGNSGLKFSKVIGSDLNPEFVQFANEKYGDSTTSFEVFDVIGEIPRSIESAAPFDVVTCFQLLNYMDINQMRKAILNVKSLLKADGYFYFFFPLTLAPSNIEEKLLRRFSAEEIDLTRVISMYKTIRKDKNFTDEIRNILNAEGFNVKLFEFPTLQYTYDEGEMKDLFKHAQQPLTAGMTENQIEELLNEIVKVYEDENLKLRGNPRIYQVDYFHCLAKLSTPAEN